MSMLNAEWARRLDVGRQQQAAQQQQASRQQRSDAMDANREMHERSLQQQEQRRRTFESQSAHDLGMKKYGVLSNLLGGSRRIGG